MNDHDTALNTAVQTDQRGRFLPGNQAGVGNKGGRPRKGQGFIDRLDTEVQRKAARLANAAVKKAIAGDPRMFVFLRDTLFGVPKQTLQVRQDGPDFLETLLAAGYIPPGPSTGSGHSYVPQLGAVVEGEARLLEDEPEPAED